MNYAMQIGVGVAIFVGIVLFSVFRGGDTQPMGPSISAQPAARSVVSSVGLNEIVTGTTDNGDVAIGLRPSFQQGQLVVAIAANTHSVDLSQYNLQQQATLTIGGKAVKPSAAPQLSGHHASGQLIFPVSDAQNSFKIIIDGIPRTQERVYSWGN